MIRQLARVAALCLAFACGSAHAATDIVVTTTSDFKGRDGQCSLSEALDAAVERKTYQDCAVGAGGAPYRVILQAGAVYTVTPSFYSAGSRLGTSLAQLTGTVNIGNYGVVIRTPANIEIIGNGAVIQRDPSSPKFRFFYMAFGTFLIRDVTFKGGNILGDGAYDIGGAIFFQGDGTLSLERVTFDGNTADLGGAVFVGHNGTLNVLSSTFRNNNGLGALMQQGNLPINVANSTFYNGSDIYMSSLSTAPLSLTHNTFGGGIYLSHQGSVVARGNVFTICQVDNDGANQGSYNIGPGTCGGLTSIGLSERLQPLRDNGGSVQTFAFVVPSQLQNFDATCTFVSTGTNPLFTNGAPVLKDARGVARAPGACDAGSYEEAFVRQSAALLPAPQSIPYSSPLTGTGSTGPYSFSLVEGPEWLSVTHAGPNYSLVGTAPSGHGTTIPIILRTEAANGVAGYETHALQISAGLPRAPTLTGVNYSQGGETVTISFDPPADDGGSPITSYVVRCTTGFQSPPSATSPMTFTVPTGDSYNCGVVARNLQGSGPPSATTFRMSAAYAIVTSLTRANPEIIAPNQRASFDVTFSRPVIHVAADDFQVETTGTLSGNSIIDVTGSGTHYQVGVFTGTGGFGSLTLNFVDIDSVFDSSLVPVAGPGNGGGDFAGPSYTVATAPSAPTITGVFAGYGLAYVQYTASSPNGSPLLRYEATCNPGMRVAQSDPPTRLEIAVPVAMGSDYTCTVAAVNAAGRSASSAPMTVSTVVTAISRLRPTQTTLNPSMPGSTVQYSVLFNYPVTGVDVSDFRLVTNGLTGAAITKVTGFGNEWVVTVKSGSGTGWLRVDSYDNDSIVDTSGGLLNGPGTGDGSYGDTLFINNLPSAPSVLGAVAGDSHVAVAFDPPQNDGGLPIIDYEAKCSPPAPAVMKSARSATSPIIVPAINGLSYLCTVTAFNSAGAGAASSPPVAVDLLPTSVAGITRVSPDPAYGATVDYAVAFTNPVTGVDASDFALAVTGLSGATIASVSGSGATYTVTVNRGTGSGTLRLDLVANGSISDASAPLAVTGGVFNGETYTILSVPTVSSIVAVGATATSAATVEYDVTFSSVVTGVDATDFTLATGGLAGAAIASVTGSGTTYRVAVNTGAGSGTLRLDLVDNDSITNGTPLGGPGAGNGNAQGPVFTIDRNAPVVQSLVIVGGNAAPVRAGTVLTYEITFTRGVTGVDATDFAPTLTGSAAAAVGAVTGSGAVYRVTYTLTGSGTVRIDARDDDSIIDGVGNKLGGTGAGNGAFTTGPVVTVDGAAPAVSAITRTGAANVSAGTSGGFTVRFSEPVTGVDAGDFSLVAGGTATGSITGVTGSGDTYNVAVSFTGGAGTLRLDLVDNDSVVDAVLNPLGGTGSGNGSFQGEAYTIVAAPTVSSFVAVGATTTSAATVEYDVTFSDPVTGVDSSDFALTIGGGVTGAAIASVTGSGTTYRVAVNTGGGSGTLRLDLVDNDSITNGTPLGGPGAGNGNAQGPVFTIDRNAPAVQSLVIVGGNGAPVRAGTALTYEITFTRSVTGVDATDFAPTLTGSAAAAVGAVTGSGAVYRVTYTLTGSGTVRIDALDDDSITDTFGNKLGGTGAGNGAFTTGPVVTVDGTAPTVSSITRTGAANVTVGASGGFTVRFSEAVTGVDAGDFNLVAGGTATGMITGVTGTGDTYDVAVSFTGGTGTLRLDLVDNDSVMDAALNPLGGAGAGNGNFQGEVYNVAPARNSYTGNSPTGTGVITATFTGGGPSCAFATAQFIAVVGDAASPPAGSAPPGAHFPHGLFDFSLAGCTAGSTISMSITYPSPLSSAYQYWKYGPTAGAAAHWYVMPATIAGNTVTFTITDGGLGDDDLTANGAIVDAGGVAVTASAAVENIPTLSQWSMLLLALMMVAVGWRVRWAPRG